MREPSPRDQGFTLIELLIVVDGHFRPVVRTEGLGMSG